jgi:TP901 family phage tail tape measure protein
MAAKLNNTANTLSDLGEAASEFTKPLAKGLETSKGAAISFESGMAEVRKTTGLSAEKTAELGGEIKKLSRTIPLTTEQLTEIGVAAGQSGVAMAEIPQYIKDISKASVALAVDTDAAGLAFGRLTNIYGMSNAEIPKLAAAINVLGDTSVASEKEILNVIMRTAALSKQANLTAKDSAALGASFVSLGMAPQVAATAINALLSRMTTAEIQSARFQKGLGMIGMSGKELQNLTAENGTQAIFTLGDALDKLDPQERAKAIGLMFGAEHSDNVGVFIDRMDVFKTALGGIADDQSNVNRYNEVFATQLDTTASKMQMLNNSFQELAIEIGMALLPAVKAFAAFLTPIINKMTEFAAKHPNIVRLGSALAGLAISIGPLLFGLATLAKAWGIFSAGIPIISRLSNQFLGVGNPISRFLNWLALGNQRLLGMGKAAEDVKAPEVGKLPKVKETLPICIEPIICDGFEDKLKALAAKIDYCIPVCICPEICEGGKLPTKEKENDKNPATQADRALPKEIAKPKETATTIAPLEVPAVAPVTTGEDEKKPEQKGLSIPQIAMLIAALGATVFAIQKLTDSNAGLGEKVISAATAIGAGLAAKDILTSQKTPQEEATELGAIQQQNEQQIAATQQANADKLNQTRLAGAEALAAVTQANQAAEIATADKIAAGKLAAQQASNQLAAQAAQAQIAAQQASAAIEVEKTRQVTAQQVAAAATTAAIAAATKTQTAVTGVAESQAIAATQLKSDNDRRAAAAAAAEQAAAAEAAQREKDLQAAAAAKAEADRNFTPVEDSAPAQPAAQKSGGGLGGLLKNAAMLGAGAIGLGGVAFAVSKVAGGLGGAVGGLLNATKSVAGAVGQVAGGVGKVAGGVGTVIDKGNQVARGVGGVAGGAIGTGIRGFQAANSVAKGVGEVAGTSIGGTIKSIGAIGQTAKDSGAAIGQAMGSAIKGTQSLGAAANSAGSGIMGSFGKAANTISGSVARVGSVANGAAANTATAWSKVQKAANVTGTAMRGATGAISNVLAPGNTGTVGIGSTFTKSISGIAGTAKNALSGAIGEASKLAASPAGKLAVPVATSLAGTVGAAALAGQNQAPTATPTPAPAALPQNQITPFKRRALTVEPPSVALPAETPSPAADIATSAKNNIVPLVRSSNASGRAIGEGLAKGIDASKPQAELAAAGLAQSVSSYLPRSPAERGPLSDLDKTGFGLTQEFIKGIDGSAIQSKFEEVLNPPSKLADLSMKASEGSQGGSNSAVYSPTYNVSGQPENLIAELEKHDRSFMDWLERTQDRFSRGRY